MARKEKRAAPLGTEEKPYSKFQWFLFAIIPVVFTVLMALVIMSVLDVNVFQWAKDKGKDIPLISGLIDNNEMTETEVAYEKRIVDLEAEIKDSEAQIGKLENIIETKDQEIQKSDIEKERLKEEVRELRAVQTENKKAFTEIIRTYESMAPKKAAPILAAMEDEESIKILSSLKSDNLAAILERMEPDQAARITNKLTVEKE